MKIIIFLLQWFFATIGWFAHFFWSPKIQFVQTTIRSTFITALFKNHFNKFGKGSYISTTPTLQNANRIAIGNNVGIGKDVLLRCYNLGQNASSRIIIGDGSRIGDYSTISSCKDIIIGKGVLTGRMVMITDNSHGHTDCPEELEISPILRPLVSKGAVKIEDNVWIGEKVSIMPNVTIGKGAIIAANAVVTKDIPAYAVAAGCPAKVVKIIK